MDKTNFENLPSTNTPVEASNLNTMQSNIEKSVVAIGSTAPSTSEKFWVQRGKNLFDKNKVVNNYELASGGASINYNDTWYVSDYIVVEPNTVYYLSGTKTAGSTNAFYDSNKTLISSTSLVKGQLTTPANTKYIRFNGKKDELNDIMLEQNSTATVYEAYVEKKIMVKDNNGIFETFCNEENKKITTGSATLNTSYISRAEANQFVKAGNIVRFNFTLQITGTWSNTTKFASGLPKPASWLRFVGIDTSAGDKPIRFAMNNNGEISNWYSATTPTSGHLIEGGVTYITVE